MIVHVAAAARTPAARPAWPGSGRARRGPGRILIATGRSPCPTRPRRENAAAVCGLMPNGSGWAAPGKKAGSKTSQSMSTKMRSADSHACRTLARAAVGSTASSLAGKSALIEAANVLRPQQQFPMADVDHGRQRPFGMQQKIAVRKFRRAIAEVVNVQMGIELNDQCLRLLARFVVGDPAAQLFIERQDAEMVAGNPQQEVVILPNFVHGLAGVLMPGGIGREGFEGELLEANLVGVGPGPRRRCVRGDCRPAFPEKRRPATQPPAGCRRCRTDRRERTRLASSWRLSVLHVKQAPIVSVRLPRRSIIGVISCTVDATLAWRNISKRGN